jgi:hypothetical protein
MRLPWSVVFLPALISLCSCAVGIEAGGLPVVVPATVAVPSAPAPEKAAAQAPATCPVDPALGRSPITPAPVPAGVTASKPNSEMPAAERDLSPTSLKPVNTLSPVEVLDLPSGDIMRTVDGITRVVYPATAEGWEVGVMRSGS